MGCAFMEIKGRTINKRGMFQKSKDTIYSGICFTIFGLISTCILLFTMKQIYDSETIIYQGVSVLIIETELYLYIGAAILNGSGILLLLGIMYTIQGLRSASEDFQEGTLFEAITSGNREQYIALLENVKKCISCGSKLVTPNAKYCIECGHKQD